MRFLQVLATGSQFVRNLDNSDCHNASMWRGDGSFSSCCTGVGWVQRSWSDRHTCILCIRGAWMKRLIKFELQTRFILGLWNETRKASNSGQFENFGASLRRTGPRNTSAFFGAFLFSFVVFSVLHF